MRRQLRALIPSRLLAFLRPLTQAIETRLRARRLRALYGQFIRPMDLVFDVGAHIGEHAAHFLALGAKVVAVEPLPACHDTLRALAHRHPSLFVVPAALGDVPGIATLAIPNVPAHATLFPAHQKARFPGEDYTRAVPVPVTTLENLMDLYGCPEYVKIDAEGAEMSILQGMGRRPRFLSFEFSREHFAILESCVNLLKPARFNVTLYDSHRLALPEFVLAEGILGFLKDHPDPHLCGDIFCRTV